MEDYDFDNPYGRSVKRVLYFFGINVLTYEGEALSIRLSNNNREADNIVFLLNVAFREGYERRSMVLCPHCGK